VVAMQIQQPSGAARLIWSLLGRFSGYCADPAN
jgi:hypothetical protein